MASAIALVFPDVLRYTTTSFGIFFPPFEKGFSGALDLSH